MIKMNESTLEKEIKINFWRQYIMEGLLKAIKIADEIKEGMKRKNGKAVLIEKYGFSPHQAQSLMDLRKPIDEIDELTIKKTLRAEKNRRKSENAKILTIDCTRIRSTLWLSPVSRSVRLIKYEEKFRNHFFDRFGVWNL